MLDLSRLNAAQVFLIHLLQGRRGRFDKISYDIAVLFCSFDGCSAERKKNQRLFLFFFFILKTFNAVKIVFVTFANIG